MQTLYPAQYHTKTLHTKSHLILVLVCSEVHRLHIEQAKRTRKFNRHVPMPFLGFTPPTLTTHHRHFEVAANHSSLSSRPAAGPVS
jgi:hypothetical protein